MKNDEQMYQSVLSRRDAYRTKKERQKRVFLRAVPVLACCCLAAVLGIGYWDHLKKLPEIPSVQVDSEVSGTTLPVTTVPAVTETGQTVTTAARTEKTKVTSAKSTETVTKAVTVTEAAESAAIRQTETQAVTVPTAAQTRPVTQTQPVTQTKPVTEPPAVTTEEPGAPEPPAQTTEPFIPSENPQNPQKEEPGTPQAQPLMYPDIEAAAKAVIDAVINGNCPGNDPREKGAYTSMFGSIMHNGYLYQVSSANGITRQDDRGIMLLPRARYEDIGAACRAVYQGQSYYVAFHYADYRGMTMPEYLQRSMKVTSDKDVTVNGETVCLRFADDGQITANAFVERNDGSDVYYTVRAAVSETEMLDFLNEMQYEKIAVYDYWIL
ncbi:MAG: hypothetical protein IKH27_01590 [Oscillospiraceae bacterium]|nr:hypothetical protein [Oscillospiraceae bacterium]